MSETQPLEDVLEQADKTAASAEDDSADLGDLIRAFGDRAFGPVLTLMGLLALSPFGAVPGVPAVFGIIIILFAGQILVGRRSPWLPGFVDSISIDEETISSLQSSASGWLAKIDGFLETRFEWAAGAVARRLAAAITVLLAAAMIPLEAIPFAVAIPASGVALLGVGLTARDGLVMLFGFTASAIAAVGVVWLL